MKIWYQHGSEHSANLVMIGHFENATDATKAKEIIDTLTNQLREEEASGTRTVGQPSERYGEAMLDLLGRLNVASISPRELDQFLYDVSMNIEGSKIILTTEEVDISAFLKVMFDQGARIEVYSAHDYPDSEYGRGRR
ncbi:DUF6375 family protein [Thauera aminoaromatica]|uniref:Uncharacterized protein n=1 Tax=Thauera aminoaromatica TaxID=164330 RepID=A0A5C7T7F5_THASP|nr:DUF6375 family protein [Thauera aminoaromatica]TXH91662.1 MAG: hypothetical protein E6Q80_02160 [Thauera aminoaromatica]